MNILGISSDFHDASAALLQSGRVVVTAAEERFSYQKHDPSFPRLAIENCLRSAGMAPESIDCVAYHEDPVVKFSRLLTSRVHRFPRGVLAFAQSLREMILGQLWAKLDIFKATGISSGKVHYVPHHVGHAAYAFGTSGLDEAAVLVLDAVGEWSSTSYFRARRPNGVMELEPVGVIPYPHSLGMLYSAFTAFLGFKVNDGECSVMALASFGQPKYLPQVRRILRAQADGTYELDLGYFDFSDPARLPLTRQFFELFGPPRDFRCALPFASTMSLSEVEQVSPELQRYADIAASVQMALEEAVLSLCAKVQRETGLQNLCLAGGVALNSTMNGRILRESAFRRVHIPPDPGDGGGALGAAMYLSSRLDPRPTNDHFSAACGVQYDESATVEAIPSLRPGQISEHRLTPTAQAKMKDLVIERFGGDSEETILARAVDDLKAGKIVGWFQGKFENGPRALGNRSLLIDPRNAATAKRLSQNVKLRASFRPYACSLTEENGKNLFDFSSSAHSAAMRWMSATQVVKEDARESVRQALHIDGSTRPQILRRDENPRYHRLLQAWQNDTGVPALLNTSFNESGYPLVSTPADALLMFLRTDIDTLILNQTLIRKKFA